MPLKKQHQNFRLYSKLTFGTGKISGDCANDGDGKTLPEFQDLKPGMSDAVVPALRERLAQEGDYVPCNDINKTDLYDECLFEAVQKFQIKTWIGSEGFVGKMTRKALYESAEE